jgi:hypothetical protein
MQRLLPIDAPGNLPARPLPASMTVSLLVAYVAGVRRGYIRHHNEIGTDRRFPRSNPVLMVELRGFEPLTFSLRMTPN